MGCCLLSNCGGGDKVRACCCLLSICGEGDKVRPCCFLVSNRGGGGDNVRSDSFVGEGKAPGTRGKDCCRRLQRDASSIGSILGLFEARCAPRAGE